MQTVLLVIHVLIALALITVVLLQKSEGGGLGMGTGGGMSGFMTGRSAANLLTRTTAILFACFIATSVLLAVLAARQHNAGSSILNDLPISASPATAPAGNAAPAKPAAASAPAKPAAPAAAKPAGVPLAN